MARPRLHHTPEEKKAANRLKSKKYYDSNRDAVLRRRKRVARQRLESRHANVTVDGGEERTPAVPVRKSRQYSLETIQRLVGRHCERFEKAMGGKTAAGFLSLVCLGFETQYEAKDITLAKDFLMEKELVFRRIQRALERYQELARSIDESGEVWKAIEATVIRVSGVVQWLDDLLCLAIVDPATLVDKFRRRQLKFQLAH